MLSEKLKNKHLILASGSPRRQHFLRELDLDFEIRLKKVDEIYPDHLKAEEITDYLVKLKADPFKNDLKKEDVLITSDTIVWLDKKAIEKPKDRNDAISMLQLLSNKTHTVISSVCFTSIKKQVVFHDFTHVQFNKLTIEEIQFYVDKYKPFDKAGSYGIQEWIGYIGIKKIDGSYFNVMGFPVQMFYQELLKF